MRKILLATDGSDNSNRAALYLLEVARSNPNVSITILHVTPPRENYLKFTPWVPVGDIEQFALKSAGEILSQTAEVFEKAGFKVTKLARQGEPGPTIAEVAKSEMVNLIVMGTRGLSDLKGLVLGSVSHQVIHFAHCPVTMVK